MNPSNPATPAPAATPGASDAGKSTPSATTPAASTPGAPGTTPEGTVTISAREHAQFLRDHARVQSFEKRKEFQKRNPAPSTANDGQTGDPDVVEALQKEQNARAEAENRALRAEIKAGINDILAKPEYTYLPESTKALIREKPHMLSEADNVEEALLDIEDRIREISIGLKPNASASDAKPGESGGHETPPAITSSTPAPVDSKNFEDTSKLTGMSRSRAVLRNAMKKAGQK